MRNDARENFAILSDMIDDYRAARNRVDRHFVMPEEAGERANLNMLSTRHAWQAANTMLRIQEFCETNDLDFDAIRERLTADLH